MRSALEDFLYLNEYCNNDNAITTYLWGVPSFLKSHSSYYSNVRMLTTQIIHRKIDRFDFFDLHLITSGLHIFLP